MKFRYLAKSFNFQKCTTNKIWQERVAQALSRIGEEKGILQTCEKHNPVMCQLIKQMFPNQAEINAMIGRMQYRKREELPQDCYESDYLPFNSNNVEWLSEYLNNMIYWHRAERKVRVGSKSAFVQTNPFFCEEHNQYEYRLAGELIYYMLNSYVPNALTEGKPCIYHSKGLVDFDKIFRRHVVDTLKDLGLKEENIEVALEIHADKWRFESMALAFENEFYSLQDTRGLMLDKSWNHWKWFRKAHQKAWIQKREFEYFKEHKDILKRLGLVTKNMTMNTDKLHMLNKKLKKFDELRQRLLQKYRTKQENFERNI